MAKRTTIERILRDDDDDSGQTVRAWQIQREGNFITLRDSEHSKDFIALRSEDCEILAADLREIAALPANKEG